VDLTSSLTTFGALIDDLIVAEEIIKRLSPILDQILNEQRKKLMIKLSAFLPKRVKYSAAILLKK